MSVTAVDTYIRKRMSHFAHSMSITKNEYTSVYFRVLKIAKDAVKIIGFAKCIKTSSAVAFKNASKIFYTV